MHVYALYSVSLMQNLDHSSCLGCYQSETFKLCMMITCIHCYLFFQVLMSWTGVESHNDVGMSKQKLNLSVLKCSDLA